MTPSLSVPTDNIYKFASLFGLAIIIAAVLSFVSIYSFTLKEKVQLTDAIATLEAKAERTKLEDDALARSKRLRDVHTANEKHANNVIGLALGFGLLCSAGGFALWHSLVQKRDDQLAHLQIRRLELEVAELEARVRPQPPGSVPSNSTPAAAPQAPQPLLNS